MPWCLVVLFASPPLPGAVVLTRHACLLVSCQGVLEATFHHLYSVDVMPQEAFLAWKDRVDESDSKNTALVQLARYGCFHVLTCVVSLLRVALSAAPASALGFLK